MDMLKQFFPFSFGKKPDITSLVIALLVYLVAALVAGIVIAILNLIPIIKILGWILGSVVELYVVVGIVLTVLDYFKVLK